MEPRQNFLSRASIHERLKSPRECVIGIPAPFGNGIHVLFTRKRAAPLMTPKIFEMRSSASSISASSSFGSM